MTVHQSAREAFFAGARDIAPILFGALPFGIVVGVVAAAAGLSAAQTLLKSTFVFAGASQLVMIDLLDRGAALWIIVLSAAIINLRHVIYSASLAPYYKPLSTGWKLLLSFVMVDQVYALSYARHAELPDAPYKHYYHLGLGVPIGTVWIAATAVGYFLGAVVPSSWSLNFVIPLMFLALTVPAIRGRSYLAAALIAAVVALLAIDLPHNLGLIVATLCGIVTGALLGRNE